MPAEHSEAIARWYYEEAHYARDPRLVEELLAPAFFVHRFPGMLRNREGTWRRDQEVRHGV